MQAYTTHEVAQILRLHVDAVRNRITSGELEAVDISKPGAKRRRFRVTEEQIANYLKKKVTRKLPKDESKEESQCQSRGVFLMASQPDRVCEQCRFWREIMPSKQKGRGFCTRFPPLPLVNVGGQERISIYPIVDHYEMACGEFDQE